jgi:hypothetical protein
VAGRVSGPVGPMDVLVPVGTEMVGIGAWILGGGVLDGWTDVLSWVWR